MKHCGQMPTLKMTRLGLEKSRKEGRKMRTKSETTWKVFGIVYSWPDDCSVSEQWDLFFSHWQMASAYCTTSLSIQVRGSGKRTEPSKNPRWPPCKGKTNMTFSCFSGKRKKKWSLESNLARFGLCQSLFSKVLLFSSLGWWDKRYTVFPRK